MEWDRDLASVQNVRNLIREAKKAQAALAGMSQNQVDAVVGAMAEAAYAASEPLARMAVEDTGFGVEAHKVIKNRFASRAVHESIREVKTVGIIREDREKGIIEAAVPMGVIAGLVPSTNPTSTAVFKALIAVKAGNAVIFSPHPSAVRCIGEAVRVLQEAACAAGAPCGLVSMMEWPTLQGTAELMRLSDLILATGGTAMVKAAYSSGTPALGVGPGNGPSFIERTADIPAAVRRILASKTFDNGTICASEQSIVTETCIRDEVIAELKKQGGYFVSGEDAEKLGRVILRPGTDAVSPRIVGRSAQQIAEIAGIRIPADARVLLCEQDTVGAGNPYCIEKLCPILAFYTADDWQSACERCLQLLNYIGIGHSMSMHTTNMELVRTFLAAKPVSRLMVNTGAAQGGIGASTGMAPSLTLGCGAMGGSATSDNVTVTHLFQIRRAAMGLIEPEAVGTKLSDGASAASVSCAEPDIDRIVEAVLRQLQAAP